MKLLTIPLLLACLLLAGCSGDDDDDAGTTTPTAGAGETPSEALPGLRSPTADDGEPSPTATPEADDPLGGVEPQDLTDGAAVPLGGLVLLVETGCYQCDGPAESLVRLFQDSTGTVHQDVLFDAAERGGNGLFGYAVTPDLRRLAVSVCVSASCSLVGGVPDNAAVVIWTSEDGGATWEEGETIGSATSVVAFVGESVLLQRYLPGEPLESQFSYYPDGEAVEPPEDIDMSFAPVVTADGDLLWYAADRSALLDEDGEPVFDLGEGMNITSAVPHPADDRLLVSWSANEGADASAGWLALLDDGEPQAAYTLGATYLTPWAWLDETRVLANAIAADQVGTTIPSLLDVSAGTVSPIEGPFASGGGDLDGRNYVVGGVTGSFARVTNAGADDCLNVREEPNVDAAVLGCFPDGTLLATDGATQTAGEFEWLSVTTPGGSAGWAVTEFLVQ